jgi:hypothetical protein
VALIVPSCATVMPRRSRVLVGTVCCHRSSAIGTHSCDTAAAHTYPVSRAMPNCSHSPLMVCSSRSYFQHKPRLLFHHTARFPWHVRGCTRLHHPLQCQECSRSVPPSTPLPPLPVQPCGPSRTVASKEDSVLWRRKEERVRRFGGKLSAPGVGPWHGVVLGRVRGRDPRSW